MFFILHNTGYDLGMSWLYLALLAPLLYAAVNLLDDNLLRFIYKTPLVGAAISGVFGVVPALLIWVLGWGSLSLGLDMVLLSLAAGFLVVVSYFFYFKGFESANPSVVAALLSLSPVLIPFAAHFIVDERLTATEIAGFAIVIGAAFAYTLTDVKKFAISKALMPVLTAAVIVDIVSVTNKYVYQRADFYSAYIYFSLGMLLGGIMFMALHHLRHEKISPKKLYKQKSSILILGLSAVELLNLAAEFAHDRAISLGSVSLVNALENLQPLYVLLIAAALYPVWPKYFREADEGGMKIKFILSLIMIGGIYIAVR